MMKGGSVYQSEVKIKVNNTARNPYYAELYPAVQVKLDPNVNYVLMGPH